MFTKAWVTFVFLCVSATSLAVKWPMTWSSSGSTVRPSMRMTPRWVKRVTTCTESSRISGKNSSLMMSCERIFVKGENWFPDDVMQVVTRERSPDDTWWAIAPRKTTFLDDTKSVSTWSERTLAEDILRECRGWKAFFWWRLVKSPHQGRWLALDDIMWDHGELEISLHDLMFAVALAGGESFFLTVSALPCKEGKVVFLGDTVWLCPCRKSQQFFLAIRVCVSTQQFECIHTRTTFTICDSGRGRQNFSVITNADKLDCSSAWRTGEAAYFRWGSHGAGT